MNERKNVIEGLEQFKADFKPFCGNGSDWARVDDDINLLKEQEPRVITLDELAEIYVEFKGDACPIRLSNFDLQKIIMYAGDGVCRLWTGKPTDEQRKAVKWDD